MYIIEFEDGVYSAKWKGDPGRTIKIENAQRFISKSKAKSKLKKVIKETKDFRKFPMAEVKWIDEISGKISSLKVINGT